MQGQIREPSDIAGPRSLLLVAADGISEDQHKDVKGGARFMKKWQVFLLLCLTVALTAVIVQNSNPVRVRFLWMSGQMPAILLLLLTAGAGFVLGLFAARRGKSGRGR